MHKWNPHSTAEGFIWDTRTFLLLALSALIGFMWQLECQLRKCHMMRSSCKAFSHVVINRGEPSPGWAMPSWAAGHGFYKKVDWASHGKQAGKQPPPWPLHPLSLSHILQINKILPTRAKLLKHFFIALRSTGDLLEIEELMVVSHLMWTTGTELLFSARVTVALNCGAISPTHLHSS